MYGDIDPQTGNLFRLMIWALTPMAITYLLMNFEMAQHRFKSTPAMIFCALLYVGGVTLWHDSAEQIIGVLAAVSTLSAIAFAVGIPWRVTAETNS
jgi:ABC-type proline/glycine betaine transport system permease subunit